MRYFTHNNVKIAALASAIPNDFLEHPTGKLAIAKEQQTTADLGFEAANQIFNAFNINPEDIGALVFLTKTPDYRGPATAMVLQHRLQIPQDCIVYDAPTGNAGFEQAINLGASLLNSVHQKYVLVVFGDTTSKQLNIEDVQGLNVQDAASALLLEKSQNTFPITCGFEIYSEAWKSFMVPSGGFRNTEKLFEQLSNKRAHQTKEDLHFDVSKVREVFKTKWLEIKSEMLLLIKQSPKDKFSICINVANQELAADFEKVWSDEELKGVNLLFMNNNEPYAMSATTPLQMEQLCSNMNNQFSKVISLSIGEGLSVNSTCFEIENKSILKTVATHSIFDNGHVTHEM